MSSDTPLLDGIRVLDLSSVGPASRASRMLSDYGAAVIKVGPTAKKGGVQVRPPFHTYGAGRGMQKIRIDLKADAGKAAFLKLAEQADVVIESYRPGVVARLGIGWEEVRAVNPRIVYCSTSGYGQDGPAANWAGHDINYLALAGFLACSEPRADGGPPIPGATVADSAGGGMQAVLAILAALVRRSISGEGQYLDVSAAEGVLSLMSLSIDQYLATGEVAGPRQTLLNLCKALGLERYAAHQLDDTKQAEIRKAFQEVFVTRDRDDWVALLAPNNTCVAPVYSIPEVVADSHFRSRGIFMQAEDAEHGAFEQVGPILAGGRREQPVHRTRPHAETDTDDLLAKAGMSADAIASLKSDGVVE